MSYLPLPVTFVARDLSGELESLRPLLNDTHDLGVMWRSVEKHHESYPGDLPRQWVYDFLWRAHGSMQEPGYLRLNAADRKSTAAKIEKLTAELTKILEQNGLDFRLVDNRGHNFNGHYILDDFSEKLRLGMEEENADHIISATRVLSAISQRSREKLLDDSIRGKSGANAEAIRFARRLVESLSFGGLRDPLNQVVATATNTLYGTEYTAGHIVNLRNQVSAT